MGLFHKPTKEDFPALPDNLYVAKLAKIANKVGKESGKPYISWGFELVQPPHQKRWVWASTQPTIGPRSQSGKFLTALGINIETLDDTFNEQSLVGKYIKVLVETREDEETGDKYQNVTKLMPLTDDDLPLLQKWLSQANVRGSVSAAVHNPTAPVQSAPASAPVSLPTAPSGFPGFTATPVPPVTVAPNVTIPSAPVVAPTPAPAVAAPSKKFPF